MIFKFKTTQPKEEDSQDKNNFGKAICKTKFFLAEKGKPGRKWMDEEKESHAETMVNALRKRKEAIKD